MVVADEHVLACFRKWSFLWLLNVGPAAEDDVASAVDRAVYHLLPGIGSVHHIAVPGIDRHMADVQVAVVHLKGVEDQVPRGEAVIGYGQVVLRDVPCL